MGGKGVGRQGEAVCMICHRQRAVVMGSVVRCHVECDGDGSVPIRHPTLLNRPSRLYSERVELLSAGWCSSMCGCALNPSSCVWSGWLMILILSWCDSLVRRSDTLTLEHPRTKRTRETITPERG